MWTRYVALGDSTSEGLEDPYPGGRGYRGWTDRLAAVNPGLTYANLAVRGKLAGQVSSRYRCAGPARDRVYAYNNRVRALAARRLRGVSSGDGRVAKRPELLPVVPVPEPQEP
jgi:lysophospholipase L1-like esterase